MLQGQTWSLVVRPKPVDMLKMLGKALSAQPEQVHKTAAGRSVRTGA